MMGPTATPIVLHHRLVLVVDDQQLKVSRDSQLKLEAEMHPGMRRH